MRLFVNFYYHIKLKLEEVVSFIWYIFHTCAYHLYTLFVLIEIAACIDIDIRSELLVQTKKYFESEILSYATEPHIRLFCLLTGSVKYASSLQMKNSLAYGWLRKKPLRKIHSLFEVMRPQLMPMVKFVRFPKQIVMQNMVEKRCRNTL